MNDAASFAIPDRPAFKASEVCEIAKVQPYVLRSWESEFTDLGVARTPGGPRVYRRADVERVLRIRQLVFGEGLTLAGVRRRLDGDTPSSVRAAVPPVEDVSLLHEVMGADLKTRLTRLKADLRALLELLSRDPLSGRLPLDFQLEAPAGAAAQAAAAPVRTAPRRTTRKATA